MLQGKIHGMVATEAAAGDSQLRGLILPANKRQKFMQNVALILQMPHHPHPRMNAFVVPALGVDGVRTKNLQFAALNLGRQYSNHTAIFILEEPSHGGGKDEQRIACMPEDEGLHVAMKFLAVGFVIFAVHRRVADVGGNACRAAEVSYPMTGAEAYRRE